MYMQATDRLIREKLTASGHTNGHCFTTKDTPNASPQVRQTPMHVRQNSTPTAMLQVSESSVMSIHMALVSLIYTTLQAQVTMVQPTIV
mgnify:CR=1 FL=1